jgi:O-antigen/teichoic acid export membrane protein
VTGEGDDFSRAIRTTLVAIAGFAAIVVLGLGLIGPWAMSVLFGGNFDYGRVGLVLVGLGMGFHLTAATLNQAALARHRGGLAAAAWLGGAALFMVWLLGSPLDDQVLAVEVGYCATAALLAVALWLIDRTSGPARGTSLTAAATCPCSRTGRSPSAACAPWERTSCSSRRASPASGSGARA